MPIRHLSLGSPQYVPSYNTLDLSLVGGVSQEINRQGLANHQYSSGLFQNLQDQVLDGLQGLDEEFQNEAIGLIDQSRANIDRIFEEKGARHSLPAIQREAQKATSALRPYQQVAGQAQAYQQRINDVGADNNVDSRVRRYLQSQGRVERDKDGNLRFSGADTGILDNWRNLHDVAREAIKDVEANVNESGVFLDPETQAFYQRIKRTYRNIDKLQSVGMQRLISDREARNQMKLTLEADGYVFQNGQAYNRNEDGDLEPITVEEDGVTYNLTEGEALMQEAARIVAPTAMARSMDRQEFSYTTRNPLYFSALENDGANNGFMSIPFSTVAGTQPIKNSFELDTEIKNSYNDYQQTLSSLEDQGIIQITSDEGVGEYRVLDEGRYNSRRANLLGIREYIKDQEDRRERLQILSFQEFYGDDVGSHNLDDYIYSIREGSEEFNQMSQNIKSSMYNSTPLNQSVNILRNTPLREKSVSEVLELAISGKDLRNEFRLDSHLNERRMSQLQDYFSYIKEKYEKLIDSGLNKLSPEYKKYAELLKEDSKGRVVEIPVVHSTNDDVYKVADRLMERLIQPSSHRTSSNDVRWLNTDRAHKSIFENKEQENIGEYKFSGFSYHPDTGQPIALYAAMPNNGGPAMGTVYVSAGKSFTDLIPVNNEYAKENYYNNMLNGIASSGSRSGKLNLLLSDVEQEIDREIDIQLDISTPVRSNTEQGVALLRNDHSEIVININRGGNIETHTFDPNTNDAIMFIKDLENRIRQSLLRQHREQ